MNWPDENDRWDDDELDEERWRVPAPDHPPLSGDHELPPIEPGDFDDPDAVRWPLAPHGLYPRERWLWFEQLWADVCALRLRYRLPVRSGWWEDAVQVEALAAFAAWTHRYDGGEWDDPPGKLALLYDIERISGLLRDGHEPFHPERDRRAFLRHLIERGCQPPPAEGVG